MAERDVTTQTRSARRIALENEFEAKRAGSTGSSAVRRVDDLHVCPSCNSQLVQPSDWALATEGTWAVTLHCPDCEWTGGGIYGQKALDRYDEVLDCGTEAVLEDLQLLTRANMEEQVERFVTALWADAILPEDF